MNVFLLLIPADITFSGWDIDEQTGNPVARGTLDKSIARKFQRLGFPLYPWRMIGTREANGWQLIQIRGPLNRAQLLNRFNDDPLTIHDLKGIADTNAANYNAWSAMSPFLTAGNWFLVSHYSSRPRRMVRENGTEVQLNDAPKLRREVEQRMPRFLNRFVADKFDENDQLIPRPYPFENLHTWLGDPPGEFQADEVSNVVPDDTDDEFELDYVALKCLRRINETADYLAAMNDLPERIRAGFTVLDLLQSMKAQRRDERTQTSERIDRNTARKDELVLKISDQINALTALVPDWQSEDFDPAALDSETRDQYLAMRRELKLLRETMRKVALRLDGLRARRTHINEQLDKINAAIGA